MLEINKNPDYKSEPPILRSNSNLELESLTLSVLSILLTAKFPEELSLADSINHASSRGDTSVGMKEKLSVLRLEII